MATLGGGGGHIPLIRRRWVQHGVTAFVALVLAQRIGLLKQIPPKYAVAVLPITVLLYFFIKDPKWPLVALIVMTGFGLYTRGVQVGPINLRPTDLPYLFLVPWALLLRRRHGNWSRNVVGQQYIALFIGAVAFTLFVAVVRNSDDIGSLVIAWMRFFMTMVLVWIVPQVITKTSDVLFLLRTVALTFSAELAISLARLPTQAFNARLRGQNGPNAEGLLAVVLIALAIYSPVPKTRAAKAAMLTIAFPALYLTRSIGAATALGTVLAVYGIKRWRNEHAIHKSSLLRPARVIALGLGMLALISLVRPLDLPTSDYFKRSSAGSRLVVASAGVRIFFAEPVFGVGWQRSPRTDVIGDRQLVEDLKRDFVGYTESFFPVPGTTSITVHNAYIQVLAETGLIGISVLVITLVGVSRRGRKLLAQLEGVDRQATRTIAIIILLCLVWLNDNPIYGAQPETVTLCIMIGLLASMAAAHRRKAAEVEAGSPADPPAPAAV